MKTWINNLKYALGFGVVAVALLLGANITANAQYHDQRAERHAIKDHQRQERRQIKREQRYERSNGYYNNNGYNNNRNNGYYNNNGYNNNNNGYYNNGRYNNRGNSRNRIYTTPHRDSRNGFKRGVHHIFGGH